MRRKAPPQIVVEAGPYTGMNDSLDPTAASSETAALLQNCYPLEAESGEGVVSRPGFRLMGFGQMGAGGPPQGFYQFTKLDGTEVTLGACDGALWVFDWANRVWNTGISLGGLALAGVTLSHTARVSFVTFANKVIVSDGVHTPFAWDGTVNGGVTSLVNCPVLYGQPTVYSAKLFGIKASDRATFVWSEENDPTLGYQATVGGFTYANAWTIGQTDQNALVALRGTNAALYYWRERSIGAVFGKVNSQFVTTATHDALSTSIGTKSPWGIVAHGEGFLFPDADGRPHRLVPGGGVVPVWAPFRETLKTIPRANLIDAWAVDYPAARLMLIGYTESVQTFPTAWLVYRDTPEGFTAAGIWRGWTSSAAAVVKDGNQVPTFIHGSTDGYAYDHGNPDGTVWDDTVFVSTGPFSGQFVVTPIQHVVQAMPMASDPPRDAQFQRLDLFTRAESAITATLDYTTPRGRSTALTTTITPNVALNQYWDVVLWDQFQWASGAAEVHTTAGWNGSGRWIAPRLTHATVGERFGFLKWRVTGVPAGDSPIVP